MAFVGIPNKQASSKTKVPQQCFSQSSVNFSLFYPFLDKDTIMPGTFCSSGIGLTPLKTTYGFNFLPSAIAQRQTINLFFFMTRCMDRYRTFTSVGNSGLSRHVHPK